LQAGAAIEYSIRLGGSAFAVMLVTRPGERHGAEPQIDDRHLLDGVGIAA
jgi:hypothetical protein